MSFDILLVIPCYKERERLPRFLPRLCETLTRSGLAVRVLIVDDGSDVEQQNWLKLYVGDLRRRFPLLDAPQIHAANCGKGQAVYSGWAAAEGERLLAFVDADGAISPDEVARVLKLAMTQNSTVYAVRTGGGSTTVRRQWRRRLSGDVFRRLVRRIFGFPIPDTQCGFKILPAAVFRSISSRLVESRYCFDVELTFRLLENGTPIECVPISWEESPGSRLGWRSVAAMALSLLKLRRRLGDWRKRLV